jgi:hypothetical protein
MSRAVSQEVNVMLKVLLFSLTGLVVASPVLSQPVPCFEVGPNIVLGGLTDGVVDIRATKQIVVRSFGSCEPVENAVVIITFDCPDIRLCDVQPHHPGAAFDCGTRRVFAWTNAQGIATIRVAGSSINSGGNPPGHAVGCAEVRVDGVLIGVLPVATPDENGSDGVSAIDLAAFAGDRFGAYRGRSDMDGNGVIDAIDLSVWAGFRFGGGSESSCSRTCP